MNWDYHKNRFLKNFEEKLSLSYELLSEYSEPRAPIKIKHITCGNIIDTTPIEIVSHKFSKNICNVCYKHYEANKAYNNDIVQEKLSLINDNLKVVGEYVNCYALLDVECKKCNEVFKIIPINVFNRNNCKCPNCEGRNYGYNKKPISITNPEFAKLVYNKTLLDSIYKDERRYVECVCPECNQVVSVHVFDSCKFGFKCPACSNTISYPNRLMYNILKTLNMDFEREYSAKWLGKRRYDFALYIDNKNYIIEMDGGLGHGKKNTKWHTKEETKKKDDDKDKLAKENGFHVIRIDCLYTNLDYIKNNILNSELKSLIPVNKIDWDECNKLTKKSTVVAVCNFYNETNDKRLVNIAKHFDLSTSTVSEYLGYGGSIGLCDYSIRRLGYKRKTPIKVICLNDKKIYNTIKEAATYYNIDNSHMSKLIKSGKPTQNNLRFMDYDDYIEQYGDII